MDKNTLINKTYELFSEFGKPLRCTIHDDCLECDDHEAVLRGLDRETLAGSDFGTAGYTPLWNMTAEAIAYFLPRIIELALFGLIKILILKNTSLVTTETLQMLMPKALIIFG
ncbi:MAG: hypothetical protein SFH39_13985 [Candidatus Magnetobacterium sp. LHC-1]|nr:hypothetical protein [Nitrospirota bacterium]